MTSILHRIPQFEFPPRYGPEWGSGGIFGMKYHRGVLVYTLAMEAEVHLQKSEEEKLYKFELMGKGPRSGGDTYNAVEAVDDEIYFGGWVHAPAVYGGKVGKGGRILFNNKFSHLHSYNAREDKVRLLWSDTIAHESEWAGEVSHVVYDPVGDRLLMARTDGFRNLGIFAVDRRTGKAERINETPALKGVPHQDHVCFDVRRDWLKGLEGILSLDLATGKWTEKEVNFVRDSVDGGGAIWPSAGCAISAYSRLFFFLRGGILVGDPLGDLEGMRFVRLFDFGTDYSPSRTVAKAVGGGIMVAFNSYSQSFIHPRNDFEAGVRDRANYVNGPSVLLFITPPQVRVVSALGARITSFEKIGDKLLLGTSTAANFGADDATPVDTGYRDLSVLDLGSTIASNPPLTFNVSGEHVADGWWGGLPLDGRKSAELLVDTTKENRLSVFEYDLGLPAGLATAEDHEVKVGRQTIDLSGYRGIVSFKFETADPKIRIRISL